MPKKIYGLDPDKKITPTQVRDAMIKCFYKAHCEDAGFEDKMPESYCEGLVRKAFIDSEGDFDTPNKSSLIAAAEGLADFSKNFRNPEIIKKHQKQIQILINKLQ